MIGPSASPRVIRAIVPCAELLCLALIIHRVLLQRAVGGTQAWYLLLLLALVPIHLERLRVFLRGRGASLELGLSTALEVLALASVRSEKLSLFALASSLVGLWFLTRGRPGDPPPGPDEEPSRGSPRERALRASRSLLYLILAFVIERSGSSHGTSLLSSLALLVLAGAPLLRLRPRSELAWVSLAVIPHSQLLIPRGTHATLLGLLLLFVLFERLGSKRALRSLQCVALVGGLWSGWVAEFPCRTSSGRLPVLATGAALEVPYPVLGIGTFEPLFGARRPHVNPAPVERVGLSTLVFPKPGEYYLALNGGLTKLKVCVFEPTSSESDRVQRVFEFFAANLLWCGGEDAVVSRLGAETYLADLCSREDPGLLLCGPTASVFRAATERALKQPTRSVSFPGTAAIDSRLIQVTHNAPEVFVDGAWQLYDVNNAVTLRGQGAPALARRVRELTQGRRLATWRDLKGAGLAPEQRVPIRRADLGLVSERRASSANGVARFTAEMVRAERIGEDFPRDYSLYLASGVAYFSAENPGLPLAADWTLGSLESDAALVEETSANYAKRYGFTVEVLSLKDLERRLEGIRPMREP